MTNPDDIINGAISFKALRDSNEARKSARKASDALASAQASSVNMQQAVILMIGGAILSNPSLITVPIGKMAQGAGKIGNTMMGRNEVVNLSKTELAKDPVGSTMKYAKQLAKANSIVQGFYTSVYGGVFLGVGYVLFMYLAEYLRSRRLSNGLSCVEVLELDLSNTPESKAAALRMWVDLCRNKDIKSRY